jgi:hypothetical protein
VRNADEAKTEGRAQSAAAQCYRMHWALLSLMMQDMMKIARPGAMLLCLSAAAY